MIAGLPGHAFSGVAVCTNWAWREADLYRTTQRR